MAIPRKESDRGAIDCGELAPELRRCQHVGELCLDCVLGREDVQQAVERDARPDRLA